MKPREAAKRGRIDLIEPEIANASQATLTTWLRAVSGDFHSIRKKESHFELARLLIESGARPDAEMIHQVSRSGVEEMATMLGAHVDGENLHIAAALGRSETVDEILKKERSRASATDDQGRLPLHFAAASALGRDHPPTQETYRSIATALMDAGSPIDTSVECCGLPDITPLFHACWTGRDLGFVNLLLERGAKLEEKCLRAAVGHWQRHGDGNYDIAEMLLDRGIDINHRYDGRTMLHAFAAHEDERGVRWLLQHGADVSALDESNRTPLHVAAVRNTGTKTINALLNHNADPSAKDSDGQTPLDLAKSRNRTRIATRLNE